MFIHNKSSYKSRQSGLFSSIKRISKPFLFFDRFFPRYSRNHAVKDSFQTSVCTSWHINYGLKSRASLSQYSSHRRRPVSSRSRKA